MKYINVHKNSWNYQGPSKLLELINDQTWPWLIWLCLVWCIRVHEGPWRFLTTLNLIQHLAIQWSTHHHHQIFTIMKTLVGPCSGDGMERKGRCCNSQVNYLQQLLQQKIFLIWIIRNHYKNKNNKLLTITTITNYSNYITTTTPTTTIKTTSSTIDRQTIYTLCNNNNKKDNNNNNGANNWIYCEVCVEDNLFYCHW